MEFFKKLGIKIQLFLILVGGVIAAFLYFYVRSNIRIKKQMEYELNRVRKETELVELEKDSEEKLAKIETLKEQEADILEKIKFIEEKDAKGEELTVDELEDFFSERGF